MRERIRRFEAREGPKPNLGPFSFDENKGREVARARRWVTRAERGLAVASSSAAQPAEDAAAPVPGGGRRGQRAKKSRDDRPAARRNVTDLDSRQMQHADGGQLQGYNAQLAVSTDGLILSPELVQDCNDRRQLQPMSRAAVRAACLVHQARCPGGCPSGGCCITGVMPSTDESPGPVALSCGQPGCPCQADWIGILLFDLSWDKIRA